MYQHFYGLRELPFELTTNPKYLFLTPQHREALSTLEYGLFSAKSVTVLIGEAGTGKTTLIRAALESELCRNVTCVHVANPTLTRNEFVEMLSRQFGLSAAAQTSKTALLEELQKELRERRSRGQITAIIIDEAQSLSDELLEEIRLLANIETATEKLLPVVLVGQPELRQRLNQTGLRQLKQRVALRCEIEPFTSQETAGYISQRVRTAEGDAARLFTREAVLLIHDRSGGIPRTISVMCDNALLTGFALNRQPVDSEIVLDVAHDFDLDGLRMRMSDLAATAAAHGDETRDLQSGEAFDSAPTANEATETDAVAGKLSGAMNKDPRGLFQEHRTPSRFSLFGRR